MVRSGPNPVLPNEYLLSNNMYGIETFVIDPEETKKIEELLKLPQVDDDDFEDEDDESKTSEDFHHENELIKQYIEAEKDDEFKEMGHDFNELAKDLDEAQKDANFVKFTRFCQSYPNQILRYCRSEESEPLWVSDQKVPDVSKVPKCEFCGSKKIFELQLTCQLLHYIKELTMLDWGVLAIYT